MMTLIAMTASGCTSDSERVAQVALEGSRRQASQNEELAKLNREVAAGTRQLIEARHEADHHLLAQQQDLQTQRDLLDGERRELASERNRESVLGPVLVTTAALLVCCLPLVLCWFLLHRLGTESSDSQLTQILLDELNVTGGAELVPHEAKRPLDRALGEAEVARLKAD
jgi:hypothetical protein